MQSGNYKRKQPVYGGRWQSVRRSILKRDQYLCQIQLIGCTDRATTVDHITPVAWGGEWYDPSNLRAACANCNGNLAAIAKKHKPKPKPTNTTTTTTPTNDQPSRAW